MDRACVEVCPVDCIHFEEGSDKMLFIDPAECIDCGACQPACPVSAIFPEGDVPDDQSHFIDLNALWFSDAPAARAQVGGDAAPAATTAPADAAPAPAAEDAATSAPEATEDTTETPVEEEAETPAEAPVVARQESAPISSVPAAHQPRLSPASVAVLALFIGSAYLMLVFPGPIFLTLTWAESLFELLRIDNGTGVGITVVALLPLNLLFLFIFVLLQTKQLSYFASKSDRSISKWRQNTGDWRRNEESRQYNLSELVNAVARDRFDFPNEENSDLRSYVNCPEPSFGIEPRGTGEKIFPDIVTVIEPGNYPIAIAQIESRETVTREQADYVWALYENKNCPLYLYVPAGLGARAKDYARSANIKNIKFRTWRWSPQGMVIKEL